VLLYDPGFNNLVSPLPTGEVLNVTIGTDGTAVRQDSELSGPVPEPGTLWMGLGVIALAAWKRRGQSKT
jgi:PEP-CTERM motif